MIDKCERLRRGLMVPDFLLPDAHLRAFQFVVRRINDICLGQSIQCPGEFSAPGEFLCGENLEPDAAAAIAGRLW